MGRSLYNQTLCFGSNSCMRFIGREKETMISEMVVSISQKAVLGLDANEI